MFEPLYSTIRPPFDILDFFQEDRKRFLGPLAKDSALILGPCFDYSDCKDLQRLGFSRDRIHTVDALAGVNVEKIKSGEIIMYYSPSNYLPYGKNNICEIPGYYLVERSDMLNIMQIKGFTHERLPGNVASDLLLQTFRNNNKFATIHRETIVDKLPGNLQFLLFSLIQDSFGVLTYTESRPELSSNLCQVLTRDIGRLLLSGPLSNPFFNRDNILNSFPSMRIRSITVPKAHVAHHIIQHQNTGRRRH